MTVAGPMPVLSASVIFFFPRDGQLIFFEGQVLLRDVRDDRVLVGERLLEFLDFPLPGLLGDVGPFLLEDACRPLEEFLAPREDLVRVDMVFVGQVRDGPAPEQDLAEDFGLVLRLQAATLLFGFVCSNP